MEPKRI